MIRKLLTHRRLLSPIGPPVLLAVLESLLASNLQPVFPDWKSVVHSGGSGYSRSTAADMQTNKGYANHRPWPWEELLYIQSNSRLLIGQNPRGVLRFMALPTKVYPVPTGLKGATRGIQYDPGMFYHFDSLRLSDLSYQIQLEGEDSPADLVTEESINETRYADQFLPLTRSRLKDLDVSILSYAPFAPDPASAPLAPAPLPGPAGALYVLRLENGGKSPVKGTVMLKCPKTLHGREPQKTVNLNTLILTVPEGSVGIHMNFGAWNEDKDAHVASRSIEIPPGEELVIETRIAMEERFGDVMPRIYELFLHSGLEWLNYTAGFWKERLGRLTVAATDAGREAEISRDLYIRWVIDNFCCLQTDAVGNLVSHYQGAPREGTIWGIDYEPTLISIARVCPELTKQGILFTMRRNRPPRGQPDHSLAILVSPILIARKWLELTGDVRFFESQTDLVAAMSGIIRELQELKAATRNLYPSRYSSDGPVGRKYDHGTNVKVWYAFDSYAYILEAMGKAGEVKPYRETAEALREAINETMVIDGPFGRQLSGGTNLGADPGGFYLPEGLPYYDGEDTGSHLAPVYGVYDFLYEPWVNYHRFARSIFCSNYEPEFGGLRWYPSWRYPSLDGTGFVSRLAGSVTRREMMTSLRLLYENGCDETGSLYWWPIARNFKRGVARCSQGQGTWAWQYLEQWLGIKLDSPSRTLTLAPRGLPTQIEWEGFGVGGHNFDIHWREAENGVSLKVKNLGLEAWTLKIGIRPFRAGAEQPLEWHKLALAPGKEIVKDFRYPVARRKAPSLEDIVSVVEGERLGNDGLVFLRYGTVDPLPEGFGLWETKCLDLRFYILNATGSDWSDLEVSLTYPEGWLGQARQPEYWRKPDNLVPEAAVARLGSLPARQHRVAPFRLKGPRSYEVYRLSEGKSPHYPSEAGPGIRLPAKGVRSAEETSLEAILTATAADGHKIVRRLKVPVQTIPIRRE